MLTQVIEEAAVDLDPTEPRLYRRFKSQFLLIPLFLSKQAHVVSLSAWIMNAVTDLCCSTTND